jgi:energy-coupling factor transporter ATP-binding protein EcfA2
MKNLPDDFEVRNLTFHYPDGKLALERVSIAVQAGETVGLVGANGAGKSTLLLHLNGILPSRARYEHHHEPWHGKLHHHSTGPQVWIGGIPVEDRHLCEVRRRVGLLFQNPDDQLFCPTVLEDVSFGPRNLGCSHAAAREIASRCLADVGLAGFESRLTHHLSFGERKRICLAAVLACEPTILALDEPTSNLDPVSRRQFIALLESSPLTKLVATHDLELVVQLCDRVIVLDGGKTCAEGPAPIVLADEELMERHRLVVPLSLRPDVRRLEQDEPRYQRRA